MKFVIAPAVVVAVTAMSAAAGSTVFTSNLTTDQVIIPMGEPDPVADGLMASAVATLSLNEAMTELTYQIQFTGLDLIENPMDRTGNTAINAIHLHVGEPGTNGPHTLNIFGFAGPGGVIREDDANLVVDYDNEILSGVWDNTDVANADMPWGSKPLSDFIDELFAGNIYFQAHTDTYTSPGGALRGAIVPAPASALVFGAAGVFAHRRRR